jgi:hypothetical protein
LIVETGLETMKKEAASNFEALREEAARNFEVLRKEAVSNIKALREEAARNFEALRKEVEELKEFIANSMHCSDFDTFKLIHTHPALQKRTISP